MPSSPSIQADVARAPLPIAARALVVSRGGEALFAPLDFDVSPGVVLIIEGDNGSGKTSLLRLLAGLLDASAGTVDPPHAARPPGAVALIGHSAGLKTDLDARANLAFLAALAGAEPAPSIDAALDAVGLGGYGALPLRQLSAGQKKRVALAALARSPAALWLLDEPYANLDRAGHALIDRLLAAHLERGGAAVVSSHGHIGPSGLPHARVVLAASAAAAA